MVFQQVGPYAARNVSRTNGHNEAKLASSGRPFVQQLGNNLKTNMVRLSLSHNTESGIKEPNATTSVTRMLPNLHVVCFIF